jgi:hypothetical protein
MLDSAERLARRELDYCPKLTATAAIYGEFTFGATYRVAAAHFIARRSAHN